MIDLLLAHRFPTRAEVERANSARLKGITSVTYTYTAEDRPGFDSSGRRVSPDIMKRLLERLVAPPTVTLKVSTKVSDGTRRE